MPFLPGDVLVSTGKLEYIVAVAVDSEHGVVLENVYGYWKSKYSDPETFVRLHRPVIVSRAPKDN
jgi:hypothetical protein